ncbi:MAG: bifunctional oligoribonuclease/PAP phosphatase NrnA [Sedimentibacter sp.]
MTLKMNDVKEIFNIINNSDHICISGHKAPDGDCIGSVMALYGFLKPLNKKITVLIDGSIPFNYKHFVKEGIISQEYDGSEFDVLFILDCSDAERLGRFNDIVNHAKKSVCIDHHITNDNFADINIIDSMASSTGELLFDVMRTTDMEITKEIATNIYIAIVTDTGKFSYSKTSSHTHQIAAELIDIGVDVAEIDNILYNSKPSNVVKAYIECISNIELYYDNKFGITTITQEILNKNDIKMGDVDGVVEFIREIKEVEVSCVLKEAKDKSTKVSLRSKNDIDVAAVSVKFGGGGHVKAAGFELNETIENAKKILVNNFKEYFGE